MSAYQEVHNKPENCLEKHLNTLFRSFSSGIKLKPGPTCEASSVPTAANVLASEHYHTLSDHVVPVNAPDGFGELLLCGGRNPPIGALRVENRQDPGRCCACVLASAPTFVSPSDVDSVHHSGAVVLRLHIVQDGARSSP